MALVVSHAMVDISMSRGQQTLEEAPVYKFRAPYQIVGKWETGWKVGKAALLFALKSAYVELGS